MIFGEKIPKMGTFSDFVTIFFVKCYNNAVDVQEYIITDITPKRSCNVAPYDFHLDTSFFIQTDMHV